MQHDVSDSVLSEQVYQIVRIDDIALGLGHLGIACQQPWMTEYLLGKRYIQCHQHDRPVDRMETDDILADQVQICRPVFLIQFIMVSVTVISQTGNIVAERVDPYIDDMIRIKVYRDAPFKGCT